MVTCSFIFCRNSVVPNKRNVYVDNVYALIYALIKYTNGRERIEEVIDPELTIERALETYAKKGYSMEWINQPCYTMSLK